MEIAEQMGCEEIYLEKKVNKGKSPQTTSGVSVLLFHLTSLLVAGMEAGLGAKSGK